MKPITEMSPAEYALFMKGRGIDIDTIGKKPQKQLSEAERFFSQPYSEVVKYKREHPQEYERLAAQLEKERGKSDE